MNLVAALGATTRAAGFFVLQYILACVEGSLEEEKKEEFYKEANRKGDDEEEKKKNRDKNGVHRSRTLWQNVVGVNLFQADGAIVLIFRTRNQHKYPRFL